MLTQHKHDVDLEQYFEDIVIRYEAEGKPCLYLPSLSQLARYYKCPESRVLEKLEQLQGQGYDFFMFNKQDSITFWHPCGILLE